MRGLLHEDAIIHAWDPGNLYPDVLKMEGKLENAQVGPACLMSWLYSVSREQVEVTELESYHEVVSWLLMSQAHAFGCLIISIYYIYSMFYLQF